MPGKKTRNTSANISGFRPFPQMACHKLTFAIFFFLLVAPVYLTGCVNTGVKAIDDAMAPQDPKGTSASNTADAIAEKTMVQSVTYLNTAKQGPPLVVLPGQFKTTDSNFTQKFTSNNIADFAELELGRANFKVLERANLGPLLDEVALAVNMGDPKGLRKFRRGKFLSTRWFVQLDVLRAEPAANAGTGFDGEAMGEGIQKMGRGSMIGLLAGGFLSTVKNTNEVTVWIIGIRYKILDASTCEIVKSGYIEDKMEIGDSTTTVLGLSQSEHGMVTMDSMVHQLVQKCVVEIDMLKEAVAYSAPKNERSKNNYSVDFRKIVADKTKQKIILAVESGSSSPSAQDVLSDTTRL